MLTESKDFITAITVYAISFVIVVTVNYHRGLPSEMITAK